jgi:hypothetical protein
MVLRENCPPWLNFAVILAARTTSAVHHALDIGVLRNWSALAREPRNAVTSPVATSRIVGLARVPHHNLADGLDPPWMSLQAASTCRANRQSASVRRREGGCRQEIRGEAEGGRARTARRADPRSHKEMTKAAPTEYGPMSTRLYRVEWLPIRASSPSMAIAGAA